MRHPVGPVLLLLRPNPDWTRTYSGGAEILDYIENLVDRHGLRPHIRFGADVTALRFDSEGGTWTADTATGQTFTARSAVLAAGPLSNVRWPDIRGLDSYRGHKIHSARWDHDYDVTGKRIAVIGTGASAVPIIPEMVKKAAKVKVFQRAPGWVLPRLDFAHPGWAKYVFRRVPAAGELTRQALFWGMRPSRWAWCGIPLRPLPSSSSLRRTWAGRFAIPGSGASSRRTFAPAASGC